MNQHKKITMLVDLQYGSTGKGLASSYLSKHEMFDVVMSSNMPNAGHVAYDDAGRKFLHKCLPSGVFNNPRIAAIGPGAVFSPLRLHQEIGNLLAAGHMKKTQIVVHENAVPVTDQMVEDERNSGAKTIASTLQGSMIAQVRKMERDNAKNVIVRDSYTPPPGLNICVVDSIDWFDMVNEARNILAEGAQGYSLGINQYFYPCTTSRDCTTARFMADMSLPVGMLHKVVGVARSFPIRVGSTVDGSSGSCYPDQAELSWEEIGQKAELTTVTGRVRRVFSFSAAQFVEALVANSVSNTFLNFVNYLTPPQDRLFADHVAMLAKSVGSKLTYLGYGPFASDVKLYNKGDEQ